MKGLKTLIAGAAGDGAAGDLVPASASAAAYSHYVACGLSQNAKPAHLCQKTRKKGAFFKSNNATVFYTVCVKFPTDKNLCAPKQEAVQGTLYVNKITSEHPRQARGQLVRRGQKSRRLRLPRPATEPGAGRLRHRDRGHRRLRRAGGEVLYESLLGLSADGSPGHTTRLLEEVEQAAAAAGWLGAGRARSRSGSARAPSPACGSASPAPGRSAPRRPAGQRGLHPRRARARASREAGGGDSQPPGGARRAPRRGLRRPLLGDGRAALGALGRHPGGARRAPRGAARATAGGRFGGGTISR